MREDTFQADYDHIIGRLDAIIREQAGDLIHSHLEQIRGLARAGRHHGDKASLVAKRALLEAIDEPTAYRLTHAFSLYFQLVNLCEERERMRRLERSKEPSMSLSWLFRELRQARVPGSKLAQTLESLAIEPVLTAHPTETKRRTVLGQLRRLNRNWDHPDEILESLWHTEEIRETRMSPLNEADNVHFFFTQTIFEATARFEAEFERRLANFYPDVKFQPSFLRVASWVGGDRDGNPFVTPEISLETVDRQARVAAAHYRSECLLLAEELTHAQPASKGHKATDDGLFQPYEHFRYQISTLAEKIGSSSTNAKSLLRELTKMRDCLVKCGAQRAANGRIDRLIRNVKTFGFHLAHLDFRDNSKKLDDAPEELLAEFHAINELQRRHGESAAHRFILSMTRNADDLLRLLQLAHEAGCRKVDLVPLLETIDDLRNAPEMLRTLWKSPAYRTHLRSRGNLQEVMVGYSDSNKDGGYMAANWCLHEAQREIVKTAEAAGVRICLFHGKGGSIDRGGGTSHRSLRAQPQAAASGRIRITEQGEIISLKYSNPLIAERNFEQLTSAVIATQCLPIAKIPSRRLKEWESVMRDLAERSQSAYRAFVFETPEFIEYFRQATPIDLIEHLRIGSRPARRAAGSDVTQLRAIPWVFAWTQSRHLVSAWYGIGTAMQEYLAKSDDHLKILRDMYRDWPFFHQLINNAEMSLAKTDLGIAGAYAQLVEDPAVRERVFGMIQREHRHSVDSVLAITRHKHLLEDQKVLAESLHRRNPHVDPLHFLQIRFLEEWRRRPEKKRTETLRRLLALTVNGISFGMKSTG
ncbi:MAG: phosphoenolpyruvate carboxylase [Verrucomicrobiae bacterium]|jgi:phosphoenolpyruvate carboxylase|nr:phosphoenolpyruvate carboxylase [Verrucomicrobiae bacterium]